METTDREFEIHLLETMELAETKHGIRRTAKGCEEKCAQGQQAHSEFINIESPWGRHGDNKDLYDTPDYFGLMHEIKKGNVRPDQPAHCSTKNISNLTDTPLSSSRRLVRHTHQIMMKSYIEV